MYGLNTMTGGTLGITGNPATDALVTQQMLNQSQAATPAPTMPEYTAPQVGELTGFDPDVFLNQAQQPMTAEPASPWLGFEDTPMASLYGLEYTQSPGYQFQFDEATRAAKQNLAAQGLSGSGAELKELQRLSQGMAAQGYGNWQSNVANQFQNYLSGLQNMASGGYGAASNLASAAGQYGAGMGGLAQGLGSVRAQGEIADANMLNSFLGQLTQAASMAAGGMPMGAAPPSTMMPAVSTPPVSYPDPIMTGMPDYQSYGGYV